MPGTVYYAYGKTVTPDNLFNEVLINDPNAFSYKIVYEEDYDDSVPQEKRVVRGVEIAKGDADLFADAMSTSRGYMNLPHYGYVDGVCYEVIGVANRGFVNSVVEVIYPLHVAYIGDEAFMNCTGLRSAQLADEDTDLIERIGKDAFYGCSTLDAVYIGKALTQLDGNPFGGCVMLLTFEIDVDNVKYSTYVDNVKVDMILSKDSVTLYASYKDADVVVPDGIVRIEEGAFRGPGISSITIPASVRKIAARAISGCSDLTNLTVLTENVELGTVTEGEITYGFIDERNCASTFTIFAVEGTPVHNYATSHSVPYRPVISTEALTIAGGVITNVDITKLGSILIIPTTYYDGTDLNPITAIADNAFYGATQVKEIYISWRLSTIGANAFAGMTSLKKVVFFEPEGATGTSSINILKNAFAYSYSLSEVYVEGTLNVNGVNDTAFLNSGENLTVYAPSGALSAFSTYRQITDSQVAQYGVTYYTRDGSTYTVKNNLVVGKSSVRNLWIKTGKAGIAALAKTTDVDRFAITSLNANEAILTGVASDFNETEMLIPAFVHGRKIVGIDLTGYRALTETVTSITIPDTVTYIAADSFSRTKVKEVVLPDSVRLVGKGAFHLEGEPDYTEITDSKAKAEAGVTYYEWNGAQYLIIRDLIAGESSVYGLYVNKTRLDVYFNGILPNGDPIALEDAAFALDEGTVYLHTASGSVSTNYIEHSSTVYVLVEDDDAVAESGALYYELKAGTYMLKTGLTVDESPVKGYYRKYDFALEHVAVTDAACFTVETVKGREIAITSLTDAGLAESEIIVPTYLNGRKVTTLGDGAFSHAENLNKLTLPRYLNEIGSYVFAGTFENIRNLRSEFLLFEDGTSNVFELAIASAEEELFVLYNTERTVIYAAFSVKETLLEGFEGTESVVQVYVIPESVENVVEGAFAGLYSVRKISAGNPAFISDAKDTVLIREDENEEYSTVLAVLPSCTNFSLSTENVGRIGAYAFYKNKKLEVISGIPGTVAYFGVGAFEGCSNLTSVNIPNIESVPARMFKDCSSLITVNLPVSVREIGALAFSGSALQAIAFPELLADIGEYGFAGCEQLTRIDFTGTNIRSIGKYAFKDCITLGEIVLGTVTKLGEGAFMNTGIVSIELPEGVTEIAPYLFADSVKLVDLATGPITKIGEGAFRGTTSFTEVPSTLLTSLKTLGAGVFEDSGLRSIQIPQGVTVIPDRAFKNCKYLTSVTFTSAVRYIGEEAFYGCDGRISLDGVNHVEVSGGKVTLVRVIEPDEAEAESYETRESVVTTTITSGIASTVVAGYKIRAVGDKIVVDNRIVGNAYEDEDGKLYRMAMIGGELRIVLRNVNGSYVLSIYPLAGNALDGVKLNVSFGVTKANLGIRVSEIGARAFAYSAIESINLTDSVEIVGDEAFAYNDALQSVLIGSKLRQIGSGVFRGTPNLTGIDVNKKNTHFKSDDDKVLYMLDTSNDTWILKLYPAGRIPDGDLSYTVPLGVSGIDEGAFDGCKLERIIVREGVSVIKKGAFANAGSLKTIFFDDNLVIDDASVFEGTAVELDVPMYGILEGFCGSGVLPEGVTYKLHTPKSCFEYQTGDSTAKIIRLKTELINEETHNVFDYSELTIPDYIDGCRVTKIESLALANGGITTLTLPLLVDEIGSGALFGNDLATIILPGTENEVIGLKSVQPEDEDPYDITCRTLTHDNGTFVLTRYEEGGALQYVTLINKVQGEFLYYLDGAATAYTLPENVTIIGYGAFANTTLTSVDVTGVSEIGEAAFLGTNSLVSLIGAESATYVGDRAFEGCSSLTSLAFGEGLLYIGRAAFAGSGVTSVTFDGENDNNAYHYERYLLSDGYEDHDPVYGGILYQYDDAQLSKTMILHTVFTDYVDGYGSDVITVPNSFEHGDFVYTLSGIGSYAFKGANYTGKVVVIPGVENRSIILYEGALLNDTISEVHFEGLVSRETAAVQTYFAADTYIYYPQGSDLANALVDNEKAVAVTLKDYLTYEEDGENIRVYGVGSNVSDLVIPVYIDAKKVTSVGKEGGSYFGSYLKTLRILDNVTSLASSAFRNCSMLQSVTLGDGITVIPDSAFEGCTNLKTANISYEVTAIGAKAFKNTILTSLPVVVTSGGVSKVAVIGAEAFRGNRYLTSLTLWNPVGGKLTLGDYAFADCSSDKITMINIPDWVRLGKGVFYSTDNYIQYLLVEGDLWESDVDVKALAAEVNGGKKDACIVNIFSTRFVKVSIPMDQTRVIEYFKGHVKDMTNPSDSAWTGVDPNANNDALKRWSVYTPYECFEIGQDVGGYKIGALKLETAAKKAYVSGEKYGNGTLYIPEYYHGLPIITVGIGNATLNTVDNERNIVKRVVIADNVKTISAYAFKGFPQLTEVVFGSGTAISDIRTEAFFGVPITALNINSTNAVNIGERAFSGTSLASVVIANVGDVGVQAFANIKVSFTVEFGSARSIGIGAFSGVVYNAQGDKDNDKSLDASYLTAITVNGGLNSIGKGAFREMSTLKTVSLTFGLQYSVIDEYAFYNDEQITTLQVSLSGGNIFSIGQYAFYNTHGITKGSFTSSGVYQVGDYAFWSSGVKTVPDSLLYVGAHAYENASKIGKVDLKNVVTIGAAAFKGSSITEFTFGSALTSLVADSSAQLGSFRNTPNLAKITDSSNENERYGVRNDLLYEKTDDGNVAIKYPEMANGEIGVFAITKIGYAAFRKSKIKSARFSTLVEIGDYAFEDCDYLTIVSRSEVGGLMVGGSLEKIGAHAFDGAGALAKVSFNSMITLTIGSYAFYNATALKDVYVSADSLTILASAFDGIPAYATISLECPTLSLANSLFYNAIIYIANFDYDATTATALKGKVEADNYVLFYTPSDCLNVKDGNFTGASNSCLLHEDGTHGTIYLPLYYSYNKKITGISATGGKLKDGDGGDLTAVYHYYVSGHGSQLSGDDPSCLNDSVWTRGEAVGL